MFSEFCGGYEFWNESTINKDTPEFSPCFLETALVWVPCGFLWVAFPFQMCYIYTREKSVPLPWSPLHISKAVVSTLLFMLTFIELLSMETNGYFCDHADKIPTAVYVSVAIKAATYLLIIVLHHILKLRGFRTSAVPFVFWTALGVCYVIPLYTWASKQNKCSTFVIFILEFVLIWIQVIQHCFAEKYSRGGYAELGEKVCPEEEASILSRVTYWWMTSLVIKAYKTTLTSKDLWEQTARLKSDKLVPKLLKNWKLEKERVKKLNRQYERSVEFSRRHEYDPFNRIEPTTNGANYQSLRASQGSETSPLLSNRNMKRGESYIRMESRMRINPNYKRPSLFRVLFKTFWWLWLEGALYKLVGDSINLLQPVLLQYIIDMIENKETNNDPMWKGYFFAIGLFVTGILRTIMYHAAFNHMIILGLSAKTALIGTIYRKSLSMSNSAKKDSTVGEIVSLMSVDCQRIQDAFTFSQFTISLPFIVTVAVVQLWMLMGPASLGGLAVILVISGTNGYLGRLQQRLQKAILGFKAKRIRILNEVINGIKVLKMYTWEPSFEKKVLNIRNEEIKRLGKYAIVTALSIVCANHSPFMVNYVLILIFTLSSPLHFLDAQTAFVALSLVNILRGPIALTPFVITGIIQANVAIGRIQKFLWSADVDPANVKYVQNRKHVIEVQNGTFAWDRSLPRPTLSNINFKMKQGQLYAVVGQVGCGKSSLISAVLGEMEKIQGEVYVQGSVAYVPQEAWIQNMTLRDNILFSKPMNEARYSKVLEGCALLRDLEILEGGDMTEIGEKGINISGGQKQRVSLARAVYSDADLYLMDDPLSAVDSHVGKHLFRNVIGKEGLLKHKTRLLVTHGIHWLPMVDSIIVLSGGRISEMGPYEDLIKRNGAFAQFLQSYLTQDDDTDEDDEDEDVHKMKEKVMSDVEETATDEEITKSIIMRRQRTRRQSSNREKSFGMSFSHAKQSEVKPQQVMTRLIQEEKSQKGAVKMDVFLTYGKAMGYFGVLMVFVCVAAWQALNVYSNYWLTYWTEDPVLKNESLGYTDAFQDKFVYYIVLFTIFGLLQGIFLLTFAILALTRMVRATGILHARMLKCILRSPMSFFDTTPIGRIINRFSSDIDVMDDRIPNTFRLWAIMIVQTLGTVIVVSVNTPIFMVVIVPLFILYMLVLRFFLPTARQVKRLESVLRSPIYNHFSETITGINVIRAYKCTERFIVDSMARVDKNVKFFFAANSGSRWVGVRLEFLGSCLILAAAIFSLISEDLNGAEVGLSITYALQITISLNLVVQTVSEMEMNIVSAERVKEYTELAPEASWVQAFRPPDEWPRKGTVQFQDYTTRYRAGLDLVLRGINCNVADGEKVGIVGRTGAGKSSLTLSLFRLIESAGGFISIDGVRISDIGLHDLRSKITILPQDPVLFSGSLRMNLDPFMRFNEDALWTSLECAHLKAAVLMMPGQLEYECGEGGCNLSMGQRQLVCLARTLLHKTKVLVLDEATAAVDLETDDLIQQTIRTQFRDCTILTIAHRLNTIMDYDRVMVMDHGLIKEFDNPQTLLRDKEGVFYKMAKDAGLVP